MLYRFDGKQPRFGRDSYVSDSAIVIGDVFIGNNCYIGHGAILRGDYGTIKIGDGTAIEEGVVVHAPPNEVNRIGKMVTVGHGAILHGKSIADYAVIGMGAVISLWSEIGEWSIVAEGSVVRMKRKIPAGVVVSGNPAKVTRKVTEKDQKAWTWGKQLYVDLAKKYLKNGMHPV